MRKVFIPCVTCPDDPRYQESAVWVVGDNVAICGKCRLKTIEWMRSTGFSLATSHPFTDMFIGVDRKAIKIRVTSESKIRY